MQCSYNRVSRIKMLPVSTTVNYTTSIIMKEGKMHQCSNEDREVQRRKQLLGERERERETRGRIVETLE